MKHLTLFEQASQSTHESNNDLTISESSDDFISSSNNSYEPEYSDQFYDASELSLNGAGVKLMQFYCPFQLSKDTVEHLLQLLKSLLPMNNRLPNTFSSVMKIIGAKQTNLSKFYYNYCNNAREVVLRKKIRQNTTCKLNGRFLSTRCYSEVYSK